MRRLNRGSTLARIVYEILKLLLISVYCNRMSWLISAKFNHIEALYLMWEILVNRFCQSKWQGKFRWQVFCGFTAFVTEHKKTGLMYTKYISLYYGTYLLYCLRY